MQQPHTNTFAPGHANIRTFSLPSFPKSCKAVVVGAGAFGGWTALHLLRKGYSVTLIDAWGPGNSRSSSGDETRVIRSTYGANEVYFDLNVRALQLWREHEHHFQKKLFHNTGVLWLCYDAVTPLVDASIPFAQKHGMLYERLDLKELQKRYPIINSNDLSHAYYDPYGGYLKARESCQAVVHGFIQEGGSTLQAYVQSVTVQSNVVTDIVLSNGEKVHADFFVFACGSWLPALFPDVKTIICTKQEVYYFGAPAATAAQYDTLPVWVDVDGEEFYYGIASNANRGFKIGIDRRGELFDPTAGERTVTPERLEKARKFIAHRFPGLKNAPVLESRICPYENSSDGNFIVDVYPHAGNAIILGGGSGHGFKHGPALGEWVAQALAGERLLPDLFRLRK